MRVDEETEMVGLDTAVHAETAYEIPAASVGHAGGLATMSPARAADKVEEARSSLEQAAERPIVVITSNNEKELPDAFLRRCFFHYIRFPDAETLKQIVAVHYPGLKPRLLDEALHQFFELREAPGLKKKPSTSELLDWLKLILAEDLAPEDLRRDPHTMLPRLHGALLKNEQDVHLFERLAFLNRREGSRPGG